MGRVYVKDEARQRDLSLAYTEAVDACRNEEP
jgi:hypothetical protein